MIALGHSWADASWLDLGRIAPSLGLFAGHPASHAPLDRGMAAQLAHPRAKPDPRWRPARGPDGSICLFDGWIDNRNELAAGIGVPPADEARLYAALVARHGTFADRLVVGRYAAIVIAPDGTLRLSRSPWGAPALFWAADADAAILASVPRVLFAAGHPLRLRPGQFADTLFGIEDAGEEFWYEGVHRVPQGAIVTLARGTSRTERWYDPHQLRPTRLGSDEDYVAAVDALLDEAAAAAVGPARAPGLLLSGGLDSGLAADALLRAMPPGAKLPCFTVVPASAEGHDRRPGIVTDERDAVCKFAAMHDRIEPHFIEDDGAFDSMAEQFFAATSTGRPGQAAATFYHPAYRAAAAAGCDWVLSAFMGNDTISNDAPWAAAELFRGGKLRALAALHASPEPGDTRSTARRWAARSLLPLLPEPIRRLARFAVHGRSDFFSNNSSLLRQDVVRTRGLRSRAARNHSLRTGERPPSRRAWLDMVWHGMDRGAEMGHGFEQVFGVRQRDVMAYRPLIEFCVTVPTGQFVRGGQDRYLARRLARGRMPETQRLERRLGMHNAARHAALSLRTDELRASLKRLEAHPDLGELVDFERAYGLLDNWPQESPAEHNEAQALLHALPGAVLVGRFADHLEGRN